jgi:hypothetical protein
MSDLPFFNRRVFGALAAQVTKVAEKVASSRLLQNKGDSLLDDFVRNSGPANKWLRSPDAAMPRATNASEGEKRAFFEAGMATCVRCQSRDLNYYSHGRNGRSDGDGYGIDRIACKCGFVVDFAYDEAGGPHYFETERWDKTEYQKNGSKT